MSRQHVCLRLLPLPLLLLAACGGVASRVAKDKDAPRTIAVLPFCGSADPGARELVRALFCARLAERGFQVAAADYVDGVLAEHGWLRDPEGFDGKGLPLPAVVAALGVDAALVGDGLDAGGFNLLLVRRQSVGGTVRLVDRNGEPWWTASDTASTTGGFLLKSGQVLSELRAQGEHGTPMATIALVDAFVEDVTATVPEQPRSPAPAPPGLRLGAIVVRSEPAGAGVERVIVRADAAAAAQLSFDLGNDLRGVPMAPQGDGFVGAHDVAAGHGASQVQVHARGPFGADTRPAEVSR